MIKGAIFRCFGNDKVARANILNLLSVLSMVLSVFFLSSCSPYSESTQQRVIFLDIRASQDLNPNRYYEPAPLAITVYSINTLGSSNEMSFYELTEATQASTDNNINRLYQAIIQPGEVLSVKLAVPPGSTTIGVTGEYRDIENARWKAEIQLREPRQVFWLNRMFTSPGTLLYARFNRLDVTLAERE